MYKESKKEKIIRFLIIGVIGITTLYLFSVQYGSDEEKEKAKPPKPFQPMAVVVQEKDQQNQTPVIAIVKEHEEKPILVTYKINEKDNYKFDTINAIELKTHPTQLEKDPKSKGIWLQTDEEWMLYNEELKMEKGVKKEENEEEKDYQVSIEETDTKQYVVKLSNEGGFIIQKSFDEKPISVHKLSEKHDLWLVLFEKDTVLLIP
ncbi:hypothetical protein ABN702_02800 [Bacillus haimaensis]|uniref:hypothetical protein n=1 Tax=Bacillus haimaensis TaxID=3160967 RepID=UPI003AA8536A